MRIVVDLQGAQSTGSRNRGIGRYTQWFAEGLIRNRGQHEIVLVLSNAFADTVEALRVKFETLLPRKNIVTWQCPCPVSHIEPGNRWRRRSAEVLREAFLASLKPDMVLVASLFEGLVDDAVTSIGELGTSVPTACVLYDLIPLIHKSPYLDNASVRQWYESKLGHIRRADLLLAISDSSRDEGLRYLGFDRNSCVSISTATDPFFGPLSVSSAEETAVRKRHALSRGIVMYTGGIDHRKNIEGLIRAYAKLPRRLRARHQLAIVCSIHAQDRQRLGRVARDFGLDPDEVVFTGFVSEEDLRLLYNLCELFVFPSWHEGFGLPALEAMRCGRAVIGASTSSIPEVIGRSDALFDPHDEEDIANKIVHVLDDRSFREALERHGLERSKEFSWDLTASRAIAAMEDWHERHGQRPPVAVDARRPKLAFLSPLPPERSGISDYSAELLPELARHYDIEVVVDQASVGDAWINANCPVRSVGWFRENHPRFDRVLYHLGNSAFHKHMFGLLEEIPGVVVLHDFYLAHVLAYIEATQGQPAWTDALHRAHGYSALREKFGPTGAETTMWQYPCNLPVIQSALGVIVHSEANRALGAQWYGNGTADDWEVIPLLRAPAFADRASARTRLGLSVDEFVVCAFGMIGPAKLTRRLVDAWLQSELASRSECTLVLVGANDAGSYGTELAVLIERSGKARIKITGWAEQDTFRAYLAAADIAVQLRTLSRGETSAAVLDCMNYGLATIVNAHGSMADLPDDGVLKIPDEFTDSELARALETLWRDETRRLAVGERGREIVATRHAPRACAGQYRDAIERMYRLTGARSPDLLRALAKIEPGPDDFGPWAELARQVAQNLPAHPRQRQLLVDVSVLVQTDAKTGIQRVVRSILQEWLANPPAGYRVEPVYALGAGRYLYARRFTAQLLDCAPVIGDSEIEFQAGDLFLGLDLSPHGCIDHRGFYQELRNHGVTVKFVVYDLLPVRMPEMFVEGVELLHRTWLGVVAESDGAVCISRTVADELSEWLAGHDTDRHRPFEVSWFHLGADIEGSAPTRGLPDDATTVLRALSRQPSFLMVGTIEPRKGYAQVLSAFECLWSASTHANLVIIGKIGWGVDALVQKMRQHPELGKRLIWLEGISDEYLKRIYAACDCLVAASEGEGFGLPLIEAAQHALPIIARDLPVFREVAGEHAHYFHGSTADEVASSIEGWLGLKRANRVPDSTRIERRTWRQSADMLFGALVAETPYRSHRFTGRLRYRGSDTRLQTQVGQRTARGIRSMGKSGFLVYGPAVAVSPGTYQVLVDAAAPATMGQSYLEVVVDRASKRLAVASLRARDDTARIGEASFVVDHPCCDLEVRIWVDGAAKLEVASMEISPLDTRDAEGDVEPTDRFVPETDQSTLTI